MKHGNLQHKF